MKLLLKLFIFFSLVSKSLAQAPQGIPYQAIARNASGQAIASTAVKVRFSIRDSIATGAIKYQETHNPTTSALGLFSVNVGMGTVVSGTFSGINWGKNAKFLQVEMDPAGGSTYTDLGTTQMMSVPYALHSNTSESIKLKTSATGDTLYIGLGSYIIIPGVSDANLNQNPSPNTISDIDGNVYKTVVIGNQVWLKENLKVRHFRNGDPIPNVSVDWPLIYNNGYQTLQPAWCYFDNNPIYNTMYGKIYNYFVVSDTRGLCPFGWHVPSNSEWQTLENFLGGADLAGGKMKTIGNLDYETGLWKYPNGDATNESRFSATPGGFRNPTGEFSGFGESANWWTFNNGDYQNPAGDYFFSINNQNSRTQLAGNYVGSHGFSVRCIKD
jgi:uncharacterized protein (TIGR02145 family)